MSGSQGTHVLIIHVYIECTVNCFLKYMPNVCHTYCVVFWRGQSSLAFDVAPFIFVFAFLLHEQPSVIKSPSCVGELSLYIYLMLQCDGNLKV